MLGDLVRAISAASLIILTLSKGMGHGVMPMLLSTSTHSQTQGYAQQGYDQPQAPPQQPMQQVVELTPEGRAVMWIREAGCWGIVTLILFFYRRDWSTTAEFWKTQNTIVVELVRTNTTALSDTHSSIVENTLVTHSLKELVRSMDRRERT